MFKAQGAQDLVNAGMSLDTVDKEIRELFVKVKEKDGSKEWEDFKSHFFFSELLFLIAAKKEHIKDRESMEICFEGVKANLTPAAFLFYKYVTMQNTMKDFFAFGEITRTLKRILKVSVMEYPHAGEFFEVEHRLDVLLAFLGVEEFHRAEAEFNQKISKGLITSINAYGGEKLVKKRDELLEKSGIKLDKYKEASKIMLDLFNGGRVGEQVQDDALLSIFATLLETVADPEKVSGLSSSYLVQGNLNNITFLVLENILEERSLNASRTSQKISAERYLNGKLKAFSVILGKVLPEEGEFADRLMKLLEDYFGKETINNTRQTILEATNYLKSEDLK
ncbi:MAG: hypothetical protein IE916_00440 [Epsilonproteobacteria bacterium]|nr:hypothetical protein [Campylobacterota bacterium]